MVTIWPKAIYLGPVPEILVAGNVAVPTALSPMGGGSPIVAKLWLLPKRVPWFGVKEAALVSMLLLVAAAVVK